MEQGLRAALRRRQPLSTIPTELKVADTYLIFSEVTYRYMPAVGNVMAPPGITLTDVAYTRPRQSTCVIYPTPSPLPVRNRDRRLSDRDRCRSNCHANKKGRAPGAAFHISQVGFPGAEPEDIR